MPCLIGCIKDFTCDGGVPLITPVNGENISPWVKARFTKGNPGGIMEDEIITVGNESCWLVNSFGEPHHASIKSFEYGTTDGHKCKMDIIDEEGGAFTLFVDKILKCLDNAKPQYFFQVQFGWAIQNCDGDWDLEASPILTFLPLNLEVNFSNGVVKYSISGLDAFHIVFMAREDEADGDDAHPMCLKAAIIERMGKNEPKADVEFKRKMPDGTITDFEWKQNGAGCGPDGPISSWTCDNQNKMGTVSRWIQPFRTSNDKGVYMLWNNEKTEPTITLWEDGSLECKEKAECNSGRHLGSFVVNGGKCSNVISFNPNINWPAGFATMAQGGNNSGPMSSKNIKTDNHRVGGGGCDLQWGSKAGIMQSVHLTRQAVDFYGARAVEETDISNKEHANANAGREGITPIEADLTIQGNPGYKFIASQFVLQSYACIVVINPFHLSGPWWDGCGDWMVLADSGCNNVLSNRFWKVMGVTHQIKEGSYVTVLKVKLPVPGVEISPDQPLGTDDLAYRPMDSIDGPPC